MIQKNQILFHLAIWGLEKHELTSYFISMDLLSFERTYGFLAQKSSSYAEDQVLRAEFDRSTVGIWVEIVLPRIDLYFF